LNGADIGLGGPPKIIAYFSGGGSVSDEKIEALLAENAGRDLTIMLVKSVHQATKLQSKLDIKGLRPRGLSVEIGLIPKIVVEFAPV